jgi:histone deacetylase 6
MISDVVVCLVRALDSEIIGQAHTQEHVAAIHATATFEYKPDELDSETEGDTTLYPDCKFLDSDTYVNRYSNDAARLAIGGLIELAEAVINGKVRNGFAVIRPPGHHADCVRAQGFCLFNNVAVAAQALRRAHPDVKRLLIVDWDVHHGNGTQAIFYDDPSVLYVSIHRYQNGAFYPHTGQH